MHCPSLTAMTEPLEITLSLPFLLEPLLEVFLLPFTAMDIGRNGVTVEILLPLVRHYRCRRLYCRSDLPIKTVLSAAAVMPPYHALSVSGNQGCTPFLPGLLRPSLLCRLPLCRGMQQYVSIICHPPFFAKEIARLVYIVPGAGCPGACRSMAAMWIQGGERNHG